MKDQWHCITSKSTPYTVLQAVWLRMSRCSQYIRGKKKRQSLDQERSTKQATIRIGRVRGLKSET